MGEDAGKAGEERGVSVWGKGEGGSRVDGGVWVDQKRRVDCSEVQLAGEEGMSGK